MTGPQETIKNQLQGFPRLVGLAIGQHDGRQLATSQAGLEAFKIEGRNGLVGDNGHLTARQMRPEQVRTSQQARTYVDGITALT
ncbi:hypothetical protein D3C84_1069990 [compost metagenome]